MTSTTRKIAEPAPLTKKEMQQMLLQHLETNPDTTASRRMRYDFMSEIGVEPVIAPRTDEHLTREVECNIGLRRESITSRWVCTGCGLKFTNEHIEKVHLPSAYFSNDSLAECPECGGLLRDLQQAVLEERERRLKERSEKQINRRNRSIMVAALILFVLLPGMLEYLLLLAAALWFGPLKRVAVKMKMGAIIAMGWITLFLALLHGVNGDFTDVGFVGCSNYIRAWLLWLMISGILATAWWVIESLSSAGGGLFCRVGKEI